MLHTNSMHNEGCMHQMHHSKQTCMSLQTKPFTTELQCGMPSSTLQAKLALANLHLVVLQRPAQRPSKTIPFRRSAPTKLHSNCNNMLQIIKPKLHTKVLAPNCICLDSQKMHSNCNDKLHRCTENFKDCLHKTA